MERFQLGKTGIAVSHLGFGCVQLTSHQSATAAVNTLESAFSAGITHFDTARSYGFGRSESILSDFVKNKRDQVTIATKFGFEPPSGLSGNPRLITFAKKILKPFPRILQHAKARGATMGKAGCFSSQDAINSLEKSLRELRTDYIDIFLLHEATITDSMNHALIETLQQQVTKGKIRCFGIASDFQKLDLRLNAISSEYKILQFNDNAIDQNKKNLQSCNKQSVITHSIFKPLNALLEAIKQKPGIVNQFSAQLNENLRDPRIVAAYLLRHALCSNSHGVVLFSSMNPNHIKNNVVITKSVSSDKNKLAIFIEFTRDIFSPAVVTDEPIAT